MQKCLLQSLSFRLNTLLMQEARFLIAKQKYLEYLEAGKTTMALNVLRNEIAPLNPELDHLHALSRCVLVYSL